MGRIHHLGLLAQRCGGLTLRQGKVRQARGRLAHTLLALTPVLSPVLPLVISRTIERSPTATAPEDSHLKTRIRVRRWIHGTHSSDMNQRMGSHLKRSPIGLDTD